MKAINLAELFNQSDHHEPEPDTLKVLPEAAAMQLRELCKLYTEPCRFKIGDLVTPRAGTYLRYAGLPSIVVEIADPPLRPFSPDHVGSPALHARFDVRVIAIVADGDAVPFWQESWLLEPWSAAP